MLAAVALRLLLEFDPTRQAAIVAESKLVQGHMRIAYSIPAHQEYVRSGAPSEPILAEAAAQIMKFHDVLRTVSQYMTNGSSGRKDRASWSPGCC